MSTKSFRILTLIIVAFAAYRYLRNDGDQNGKKEGIVNSQPEKQLSNEEKTKIAAEVLRGERPKSDLEKYGISIGEPRKLDAKEKQELINKLKKAQEAGTLQFKDDEKGGNEKGDDKK